jgi:uncharacterized protein involved in type VI secretion and phage assembly
MPTNYRALPIIKIDSGDVSNDILEDILQISIEQSLHRPGMFTIMFNNDYFPGRQQEQYWKHKDLFQVGKTIKLGFKSSTTESQFYHEENTDYILEGEITAIETVFNEKSQAPVIIRGYDVSHRLHRGRYNRSFQNMTDSDMVKKIAQEAGIKLGTIEPSGTARDYTFQSNQTNMEFLKERAAKIGFELYMHNGELHFRKPKADSSQVLNLKWLTDLRNFRVRKTSAEQVNEVEVRAWDYSQKRAIVSTAKSAKVITDTKSGIGSQANSKFKGKTPNPKMIVVDRPVFNPKEADAIAQALCDELGGQFVAADAKAEGNPKIQPGRIVELKDMEQHNGKYYITETRHSYSARVYTTDFSVRGSRGGDMLNAISPQTQLQPGQTSLVGIVTDNRDPEGMGRVKVKFPTLTEEHASNWARIVSPGAGANRGVYWLPEVQDEVLVCFEHGDIHRPYILGGVWNGKDPTPRAIDDTLDGSKVRLRVEKTRCGHTAWFVDEDKGSEKRGYYLQTGTGDGHWLRVNDTEQFIEIETIGHHKIRMDDKSKFVEIKTTGGHVVRLDDGSKSISIKSTGNLSIEAQGNIEIKANGSISMNGAVIKLN